jgi:hypothetical protein
VLDRFFTAAEVSDHFAHIRTTGAVGPDAISPHCLRHAPPALIDALTALFNFSWRHGVLPIDWRSANICALLKSLGLPATDPSSFRPISLTSVVVKSLEHLIHRRLWTIIAPHISASQAGFRSHHSTADHLYSLYSAIFDRTRTPRSHLSVAFLDISKAFDRTWHAAVLAKLWRLGVRGRMWRWTRAFLTDRRMRVVHHGRASAWFRINAGVPQGSVLSPALFLVFINDLISADIAHTLEVRLYADDIALLPRRMQTSDDSTDVADRALIRGLSAVFDWSVTWRVIFNIRKSNVVQFTRSARGRIHLPSPPPTFLLGDQSLTIASSYRYLGLWFDECLRWTNHSEDVLRRARSAASLITRIISPRRPPHLPVIRQLVKAMIIPIITYGSHVWYPRTARLCSALESSYATPLRVALGLPSTAHRLSVLAECGVLDLTALLHHSVLAFLHRAMLFRAPSSTRALLDSQLSSCTARASRRAPLGRIDEAHAALIGDSPPPRSLSDLPEASLILHTAALRSSYRRWRESGACRDLIALRCGGVNRPGMADYLRSFSKRAATLCARLRFNRSLLRSSLARRHAVTSDRCTRDGCSTAHVDDIAHFLVHCSHPPLIGVRQRFASSLLVAPHVATMLADPPSFLSPADRCTVLAGVGRYLHAISSALFV